MLNISEYLTFLQDNLTDKDSVLDELLMSKFRKNMEQMLIKSFYAGVSGTLTSTPTGAGVCADTAQSMVVDAHIGHTVVFTSGAAAGNMYTIDDNTATTFTLTGDDPAADGVLSGDSYVIMYDLLNFTSGHIHNGTDAQNYIPYKSTVGSGSPGWVVGPTASWTQAGQQYIYVPTGASTLSMASYLRANDTNGGTTYMRFIVGGSTSGSNSRGNSTTPGWVYNASVDISGFSPGHYAVQLQLTSSSTFTLQAICESYNLFIQ